MKAHLLLFIALISFSQLQQAQAGIFDWLFPPNSDSATISETVVSNPGFSDEIATATLIPRSAITPRNILPPGGVVSNPTQYSGSLNYWQLTNINGTMAALMSIGGQNIMLSVDISSPALVVNA
jgi:hypothetical protein